ncbi:MAG: hypothetical protein ACRENS_07085 [Candidatus Eiseniibacteriota bacterium]
MTEPEDLPPEDSAENPEPPARSRPDWLVGAEEGVASEWSRAAGDAPQHPVKLRLVRPEDVEQPQDGDEDVGGRSSHAAGAGRLHLMGPDDNLGLTRPAGKPLPKAGTVRKAAWTAASSSVPSIRRSAAPMPTPQFARQRDPEVEAADHMPTLDAIEEPSPAPQRQQQPTVTLAPLKESWWVVVLDALRHSTQLQIAIGVVLLAILTYTFWPRGEANVSVSRIHQHPELYDEQTVRVHGKIGDVYAIAGGYTFYLLQGRDTMVVFTRTRIPMRDDNVSIRGTISTGYLDGAPRQALFEDGKK